MSHKRFVKFGLLILPLLMLHKHRRRHAGFFKHLHNAHGHPHFWHYKHDMPAQAEPDVQV